MSRQQQFILWDVTEANANIQRKLDHILFSQMLMASFLTKSESFLLVSIDFWETKEHHKNILWASKNIQIILRERYNVGMMAIKT